VSWGVFCSVFSVSTPDRVLSGRLSWILRDIWHSDPVVVSHQDPDRAIVAQAEKASGSAGQLDYLPHACLSSGVAALYDSDFKKLNGKLCTRFSRRFVVGVWYRGAANDGGTLEYVFEAGEQNSPKRCHQGEGG
jgi:hypothetical protein